MVKIWKKLSSKVLHKDQWLTFRLDMVIKPNGKPGNYGVLQTPGSGVVIVPITNKNEVYLVKQYRYPTVMWSWELPGGTSGGASLLKSAARELWEETGLKAKAWKKLGFIQSFAAYSDDIIHFYLATGLYQTGKNLKHEDGITKVKKVTLKQALVMVKLGQITDTQTISALFFLLQNKNVI